MNPDPTNIKALVFDVFGTCVDFRASIIKDCRAWGKTRGTNGLRVNWAKFADAWRAGYRPAMDRVTRGELPWTKIDALHRLILSSLQARCANLPRRRSGV
jgi:2-haloacid dehalogenase